MLCMEEIVMIDLSNIRLLEFVQVKIVDSFSLIKMGSGHGESRLYVGSISKNWDDFFEGYNIQCFFTKSDLSQYLDTAKFEYEEQQQPYLQDIRTLWKTNKDYVSSLDDQIFFTTANQTGTQDRQRYYISFNQKICTAFRKLALPRITTLLIQKIEYGGKKYAWFRPYLSELGNIYESEIITHQESNLSQDKVLTLTEKEQIIKARLGQGIFRDKLIDKYGRCIITGIDDKRVLMASHIKPWSFSNNEERISSDNGLLLSPTYDKLFDKGFISFKKDGIILLSDHFSDYNFLKVNLSKDVKYPIVTTSKTREYLEYHRDVIFLG